MKNMAKLHFSALSAALSAGALGAPGHPRRQAPLPQLRQQPSQLQGAHGVAPRSGQRLRGAMGDGGEATGAGGRWMLGKGKKGRVWDGFYRCF